MKTWYQEYNAIYENVVHNLPTNNGMIDFTDTANMDWSDIYCLREQLWAIRENLA